MSNNGESLSRSQIVHNVMQRTSELMGLSDAEQRSLFFETPHSAESGELDNNGQYASFDEIKCSYMLGIVQALHALYPDMVRAKRRLRLPSSDYPFNGRSAIDLMLNGTEGLRLTRRYFDHLAQLHS